mgnify:CR=1 FL=1
MNYNTLMNVFDLNKPTMYVIWTILSITLYKLKISKEDKILILLNVVVYALISLTLYYFVFKSEMKNIETGYVKDVMYSMHKLAPREFAAVKERAKQETGERQPIQGNSLGTLYVPGVFLAVCFIMIYALVKMKTGYLDVNKIRLGTVTLVCLGMTELFLTFFGIKMINFIDIYSINDAKRKR